jgi:hypothetical protein
MNIGLVRMFERYLGATFIGAYDGRYIFQWDNELCAWTEREMCEAMGLYGYVARA